MKKSILTLALVLCAGTALAQPVIRDATPEELAEARGTAQVRERYAFFRGLFGYGIGRITPACSLELLDPSGEYERTNLALYCDRPLTWCDVPGVVCE